MNALLQITSAGFGVSLVDGFIEVSPASALTDSYRNFIRAHKREIIRQLSDAQVQLDVRELIENTPTQIEDGTNSTIKVYCYRVKDKPGSELTVITHGEPLSEVREGLLMRYGDRLITVYESAPNLAGTLANTTKH